VISDVLGIILIIISNGLMVEVLENLWITLCILLFKVLFYIFCS